MESFPPKTEGRFEANLQLMMDYDSGYMSHNQESNSDTSLEGTSENSQQKPMIYHSEDALLEKPEVEEKICNLSVQIENEDYEQTRRLFFSSPDLLNSSVESRKTTYSGLENDSEMSVEIAESEHIVFDTKAFKNENLQLKPGCAEDGSPILIESKISTQNVSNMVCDDKDGEFERLDATFATNEEADISSFNENMDYSTNQLESDVSIENKDPNFGKASEPMKKLTLVFSKSEENSYSVKRKYPSLSPRKKIVNTPKEIFKKSTTPVKKTIPLDPYMSPDLFEEEEKQIILTSNDILPPLHVTAEERYINRKDQRLVKRAQNSLNGVLPPPSVTIMQMSAVEMLDKLKSNARYFWNCQEEAEAPREANSSLNSSGEHSDGFKSLLENVEGDEKFQTTEWPSVLQYRFHGLHHNRSKLSEEFEDLCNKYAQRFVGAETHSSCNAVCQISAGSPSRKKELRRLVKSPGRRLSHLARRRITFSSANLQGAGAAGSRARQILVDARKMDLLNRRKSPRKTPRKSPRLSKARTPSSSAKKKLAMRFRELAGEFENTVPSTSSESTSHRNILVSPSISESSRSSISSTSSLQIKRELFPSQHRDNSNSNLLLSSGGPSKAPRRALFTSPSKRSPLKGKCSPFKRSPLKHLGLGYEKKRKRSEGDEGHPAKLMRGEMEKEGARPAALARGRGEMMLAAVGGGGRPQPEGTADMQKKRLQWAVYEALRSQNVTASHAQFKLFASVLARVTRHFMPAAAAGQQRPEAVTGERMLRIARTHVHAVVKGKSVDETVGEYARARARRERPQGYVPVEEFNARNKLPSATKRDTVLQDRSNTIESWEKRKLEHLEKSKGAESKIDRIRKVINF